MKQAKKRPYVKPAITVIPGGSEKYRELMQILSPGDSKDASKTQISKERKK